MGAPDIKQRLVSVKPRFRYVAFEIAAVAISASSTHTETISLTEAYYQRAIVHLYNKATIPDARRARLPALIFATTDNNDAASQVGTDNAGTDRYMQGYNFATDGKLSGPDFDDTNGAVEIQSCRINGANLEIVFNETLGAGQTIDMYGSVYVFRDHV